MPATQAIVICTRNRPRDLRRTLRSVAVALSPAEARDLVLMVVDGSDEAERSATRALVAGFGATEARFLAYPGRPSLTRQRNYALDRLPPAIEVVHFIDDDVTVEPGYFRSLASVLRAHDDVLGAGGLVLGGDGASLRRPPTRLRRLFLLDAARPGRVLPSGHATSPNETPPAPQGPRRLRFCQWLSGCSASYARAAFALERFDERLEGSALFEDRDFSYRLSQRTHRGHPVRLVVEPAARLRHHVSPTDRRAVPRYTREHVAHHVWFVQKNVRHPLRLLAFGWALLGRVLALSVSDAPDARLRRRALLHGLADVVRRRHPLLQGSA
jgi:GT2 family glycosyltransferase